MGSRCVVRLARAFPELFFIFVLGGEDPIDHMQRETLRDKDRELHPLLERIMRIHVTEEARHLSFARHWLKRSVPDLGPVRRTILSIGAPLILGEMGGLMLKPSKDLVREYDIPKATLTRGLRRQRRVPGRARPWPCARSASCAATSGSSTRLSSRLWKAKRIWADD